MESEGARLFCKACGAEWEMDEYGRLIREKECLRIPAWYEWEREENTRLQFVGEYYYAGAVKSRKNR